VPRAGRIEAIFEALFSRFSLFRYSPDFAGAVTASWGRIWRNRRRFLSRTCPYTITSFIFFPGVIVEEKHTSVRTPFSQKTGPSFMADSSKFCGICGYFWPRRLKPTLETCWGISPIYSEMIFNVKVVDLTPRQAGSTVTSIKRFSRNIKKRFTGFLYVSYW
jgi:hypothetical protein